MNMIPKHKISIKFIMLRFGNILRSKFVGMSSFLERRHNKSRIIPGTK
jgi:hypothetical protein